MRANRPLGKRLCDRVWRAMLAAPFGICAWGKAHDRPSKSLKSWRTTTADITMPGQKQPIITAKKSKNVNRDGAIHGFTLLGTKDGSPVDGWDFMLKPGIQEFSAAAPGEPGEYLVVCTVVCSEDHEGMNMKFVVLP